MILLVIGTNRPGSNTAKVAAQVREVYQKLGVVPEVIDLHELPPEIFSPTSYATKPAAFAPMADAIVKADGIVWVFPEYNGGFPGVLKYFIDMLKFPESLEGTPVCQIGLGAGLWGAFRPAEHLHDLFIYRKALVYPEKVLLPQINKLLNAEGRLTDADLLGRLESQAKGFLEFVKKIKGKV